MNDNDHILEWLKESPLAIPLRSGKGFYVLRGKALLFADHTTMEVLDFIQCLGIWDGALVQ
jgi:hypothetical protein